MIFTFLFRCCVSLERNPTTGIKNAAPCFGVSRLIRPFEMFSEDHIVFGNKAYERSSKHDTPLPQGKIVKCGFEKNCRVVESAGEALAMLQIGGNEVDSIARQSTRA